MIIEFIIIIIITVTVLDYLYRKSNNDITQNINGPLSLPIIGGIWAFIDRKPDNVMEKSIGSREKYGRIYKAWFLNRFVVFSSDPKHLEVILSNPKHINKGPNYDKLKIWLGDGLLLSSGSKWHARRKIITPTFHFKILEQFVETFDQQSAILVERLKNEANTGKSINIQPYICLEALDIITETAMGTQVNAQTKSDNEYVEAVADILDILAHRFTNVWLRFDLIFSLFYSKMMTRQIRALKILHSFTKSVIERRREFHKTTMLSEKTESEDDIGQKKRMALLDILLQATTTDGKPLSNEDIREEVDTFMFEGHDTTTSAMCSALFEISRHPDIQEKAFTEIREVLGDDKNRKIILRDLQELKYLDCIIKETLRLHPPVPFIGRKLKENVYLDGIQIPANTVFNIQIYSMQRDENLFEDPNRFNPERFLNEGEKNNYGNIPFSAGPRNCIGQKYALLEMKSTLSKILRHYELLPLGPDMKMILTLVARSSNGVHLGLKDRKY